MSEKKSLPVFKFKYRHLRGDRKVTKALGKLMATLFEETKIPQLDSANITEEVLKALQKRASEKIVETYDMMGDVIDVLLPAGLNLGENDPVLLEMDAEDCFEYLFEILRKNADFFTQLLLSPRNVVDSLASTSSRNTISK